MDITSRQTMKKYKISLYLYDWVEKKVYWRNYQPSLMVCTTHILVQLKCIEVYESKWMSCLAWLVGWFVLPIY